MKRLLFGLFVSSTVLILSCLATKSLGAEFRGIVPVRVVTLTSDNLVILDGEVTGDSVTATLKSLYSKSETTKEPIYLFIDTPGGEVQNGLVLSQYLRATTQNIVCIAKQAQSMGFVLLQSCKVRGVTDSTILMAHELAGQIDQYMTLPLMRQSLAEMEGLQNYLNRLMTDRIGITVEAFRAKLTPMWETYDGKVAVQENLADVEILPVCSKELYEKMRQIEIPQFFMGQGLPPKVTLISACPL